MQATQEKVAAVLQAADLKEQLRNGGQIPAGANAQSRGYGWGRVGCLATTWKQERYNVTPGADNELSTSTCQFLPILAQNLLWS